MIEMDSNCVYENYEEGGPALKCLIIPSFIIYRRKKNVQIFVITKKI